MEEKKKDLFSVVTFCKAHLRVKEAFVKTLCCNFHVTFPLRLLRKLPPPSYCQRSVHCLARLGSGIIKVLLTVTPRISENTHRRSTCDDVGDKCEIV